MRYATFLKSAATALTLFLCQAPAWSGDARALRPFVGETTREFEARVKGLSLERGRSRGEALTVPADASGHFFVEPTLDGQRVRMLVDTGASLVALSHEDADAMLLRVSGRDFTEKVSTANGIVEAAPVKIAEVQIGGIVVRNVDALVLPAGRLKTSLLGMTFLKRLSAFEISDGRLILHP